MPTRSISAVLLSFALVAWAAPAGADDGLLGGLNPWSPNWQAPAAAKPASYPGSRVVNGSKRIVGGVRNLMPWRRTKPQARNEFIDGNARFFRPDLARQQQEEQPFSLVRPASWFAPEPPQQPDNMADWIGLPRPGD